MAQLFRSPRTKKKPRLRENLFTEGKSPLVSVATGRSAEEMVEAAVGLIGGFERLSLKGKSVLVKPNVVSGEKNPVTTNPEVVAAVVRLLLRHGAKKVYVGDMSALRTISTRRNMTRNGILRAAEDNGAEPVIFEDFEWYGVPLDKTRYLKEAYVTEWIYRTDLIVNLPVIKTHRSASYSITLKNFIGCTHLRQRPYLLDPAHWEELIAEFNAAYTPDLNIVDGTVSMIEGGPWEGTPARTDVVIASGDRVAADIAGLGLIRSFGKWAPVASRPVWEQKQIRTALELGLGKGKEDIKLVAGAGNGSFERLVADIRAHTGL
ncbi:MAG: hypothetical protein A2V21_311315 [Deltaproteobacteria bacterium GWC2_55_46]|nr:MAG: hypothetical protein A2Z79_12030 [Deltaproteobacteria bacterium GWA2_55_82]OGQ65240.1 MAG: hypothetical protein A3I81_02430 [Deltaproteobacteria bacterium RIFCSPLOWO2_02_FULL_55_12]OIJ74800.1 MAG: hypothetical protein A2V21_311315 [Deltaproteobacteria bacterium GWC2_55_46]